MSPAKGGQCNCIQKSQPALGFGWLVVFFIPRNWVTSRENLRIWSTCIWAPAFPILLGTGRFCRENVTPEPSTTPRHKVFFWRKTETASFLKTQLRQASITDWYNSTPKEMKIILSKSVFHSESALMAENPVARNVRIQVNSCRPKQTFTPTDLGLQFACTQHQSQINSSPGMSLATLACLPTGRLPHKWGIFEQELYHGLYTESRSKNEKKNWCEQLTEASENNLPFCMKLIW